MTQRNYIANPLIKAKFQEQEFTAKQIKEYIKCAEDPEYFIEKYIKIVSLDKGLVKFRMYEFQKRMVNTFHHNRFTICKVGRQSGKSVTVISFILWYLLFNESKKVALLANKAATSRELLQRIQLAYEHLPPWIQQGVGVWNKGSFELENGSSIISSSTSSSAIRGSSFNLVFLDEFAFVESHIAEDFFRSVYPTITSGQETKMIVVSTPYGMNHFYKMWTDAIDKKSDFNAIEVHWSEVPGRDDKWRKKQIRNTSIEQFRQEFETEFIGSSDTLITADKLTMLRWEDPVFSKNGLDIYEEPKYGQQYCLTADVSHGKGKDYSAITVWNVSQFPSMLVAKYRDNTVTPLVFPNFINQIAKQYNDAHVLVETNDVGSQVGHILRTDIGYENMIMTRHNGREGIVISAGFSRSASMGLRTTQITKNIGANTFKNMVEADKVIIKDVDLIQELYAFCQKGKSWEAQPGNTDDLVMCCLLYGWLSSQQYFEDLIEVSLRAEFLQDVDQSTWDDLTPFGFYDDGISEYDYKEPPTMVVRDGDDSWLS
tara:strand:- start:2707 stop:4332 length:1626 start_codon:yes stop_codon:yes gene_type:complete